MIITALASWSGGGGKRGVAHLSAFLPFSAFSPKHSAPVSSTVRGPKAMSAPPAPRHLSKQALTSVAWHKAFLSYTYTGVLSFLQFPLPLCHPECPARCSPHANSLVSIFVLVKGMISFLSLPTQSYLVISEGLLPSTWVTVAASRPSALCPPCSNLALPRARQLTSAGTALGT